MKGLFQCPPRAAPWVHSQSTMRPVRAKASYNIFTPSKHSSCKSQIKLVIKQHIFKAFALTGRKVTTH